MPAPADVRASVNPILTKFAVGYEPAANLIGRLVIPVISVIQRTGTIHTFGKEGFKVVSTVRAARAKAKRVEFGVGKDTYATQEHSLYTELDIEQEIKEALNLGGPALLAKFERKAINLVQGKLDVELEKKIADLVFAAGNYNTNQKVTLTGNDQWKQSDGTEGSTATPIKDIKDGIDAARGQMGVRPNTLTFGYKAWQTLIDFSTIVDRYKHVVGGVITKEMIAQLFEVDRVLVGESVHTTDESTLLDLWGDNVSMTYMPPDPEMAEGTTPHSVVFEEMGYPLAKTWDDETNRNYQVTRRYQEKLISNNYGYLLSDVNA